ncbi:fatty acid synthase alpha subunit Lsd1 [Coemansia sp. RSA 2610]|nr:fatty acid synthase alpha subunit Lsd1 [Coemansia sp. RSA 2610]
MDHVPVTGHSHGIVIAAAVASANDDEQFTAASEKALGWLMLFGTLPQIVSPQPALHPLAVADSQPHEGTPTPMSVVQGASRDIVETVVKKYNSFVKHDDDAQVHFAICETHEQFVVSGNLSSIAQFIMNVRKKAAAAQEDQTDVVFWERKPEVSVKYLKAWAPWHCKHSGAVAERHVAYAEAKGWGFAADEMLVPVRDIGASGDLRAHADVTRALAHSVYVRAMDWPQALRCAGIAQVVDFAPVPETVECPEIGSLRDRTWRNLDGRGIALVAADIHTGTAGPAAAHALAHMFAGTETASWQAQYGPRLAATRADGTVRLDTRMQRLTGMPPVAVAGLAPTTAHAGFVAAASHAGFLAELSVHALETEQAVVRHVTETAGQIRAGHGLVLNASWRDQHAWLQPAIAQMCAAQLPLIGLTLDDAPAAELTDAVCSLHAQGLRFVALKPRTRAQILAALEIADRAQPHVVMLQWFGGRTGGVHSLEEFHIPILQTYSAIRARSNVVLVAGSGFGDGEGTLPYIDGSWAEMLLDNAPRMPFDGVLLRSRVMVARESLAHDAVKQLIARAPGIDAFDLLSQFKYAADAGTVSIRNERNERVHVLSNRAALLCADLGRSVFAQPADKQLALLQARKPEIVRRLNSDYMRPWFATKRDGTVVDLEQLTYIEAIDRLVALMYVESQRRWIHPSYRNFVAKFVERAAMRLHATGTSFEQPRPRAHYDPILDEIETVKCCYQKHVGSQLLASEDIQFFLSLCLRPRQKPVPFVPVIDQNFAQYLLCDAFGQIEDLDAILADGGCEDAAQRVLIPQGRVAVGYSTEINQPLAQILDQVYQDVVQGLRDAQYRDTPVPEVAYLGPEPEPAELPEYAATVTSSAAGRIFKLATDAQLLPDTDLWMRVLTGPRKCWLHALLTAAKLVQGARTVTNYLPRVLRARAGRTVTISIENEEPQALEIHSADGRRELDIMIADGARIVLNIYHGNARAQSSVRFEYAFHAELPLLPIHELSDGHDEHIRRFFIDMWLSDAPRQEVDDEKLEFVTRDVEVTSDKVAEYCRATGLTLPAYPPNTDQAADVPMDYLSVLALPSAFRALTSPRVHSGLLHMVQTTNHIEHVAGAEPLAIGDVVDIAAVVVEMSQCPRGKKVAISAQVLRREQPVATLQCTFVFLGAPPPSHCFRRVTEPPLTVQLDDAVDIAVLESKDWFQYLDDAAPLEPGVRLEFVLSSEYTMDPHGSTFRSAHTQGAVYLLGLYSRTHIADVDFAESRCHANPALAFLRERAESSKPNMFEQAYALAPPLTTHAPASAHAYAQATSDFNPHNTNAYVSDLTGLPQPVMQGLWTSASCRQLIERHVAQGSPTRVRSYTAEFLGMVHPGDQLETELHHVGMHDGRLLVSGQTRNARTGELVLTCSAEVAQPKTVYMFTGQGSQEQGMGMDLYDRSPAARAVCERADEHMRTRFGFSILDIIRNNPKQCTVHFGGQRGAQIRKNYQLFTRRVDTDAGPKTVPLFPEITDTARSYTFQSPTGLLNATQFAQPAIMLFDIMVTAEMRAQGVFDEDAMFVGHSLGEYGALAAFRVMALEDIIDITFIRGMTMQSTVERDEQHNSAFAMVAVNPSRVGKTFDEEGLAHVISTIRAANDGQLLEIVNYNVRQFQYVVAGTRTQLALLGHVLDKLHTSQLSVRSASGKQTVARIVRDALAAGGCGDKMARTRATIPIPGIDVPFHSSHLLAGASQFRTCINMMIRETGTYCAQFANRYIPNLTAVPYEVTREYFTLVYEQTGSPVLAHELDNWPEHLDMLNKARLGRLMIIELLSYQFASPVRWIETQDRLFGEFAVEQVVEIGPTATLCRMAEGTLMIAGREKQVDVKHIFRDADDIYYTAAQIAAKEQAARQAEAELESEKEEEASETATIATESTVRPDEPIPVARAAGSAAATPDVPLEAVDVVRMVIAQKTKRSLLDIPATKSVKELTGGKSTLQNEILGDLLKEFGTNIGQIPDRPDEISLAELAQTFGGGFSGKLGSFTSAQVSRLFSTKMPGSVSQSVARAWLKQQHGLAAAHMQDCVMLLALTMEPASRLASKDEAQEWLSMVAKTYAQSYQVTLGDPSAAANSAGGSAGGAVVSSAALDAMQQSQRTLIMQQVEAYARHLGIDLRKGDRALEAASSAALEQQQRLDAIAEELGTDFVTGIQGVFDAQKARRFDSYWNWAREDVVVWVSETLAGTASSTGNSEQRLLMLANRTNPRLLELVSGLISLFENSPDNSEKTQRALDLVRRIHDACAPAIGRPPVFRELGQPTRPTTTISPLGKIEYSEQPREPTFAAYVDAISAHDARPHPPLVHLREKTADHDYVFSEPHSSAFYAGLRQMCGGAGASFAGTTALVTGCSRGSIAAQVICSLLQGGAHVIATTSSYRAETLQFYEQLYKQHGARGAALTVVPFNQGSLSDVSALCQYVYGSGAQQLGRNVDYVLPFAAVSEYGSDVGALGSKSELALRIMLTNVLRLLGEIKETKQRLRMDAQPTLAILPLSPNHGVFGFDGTYGECKAALETVFNRWESESWGSYVSVAGAKIGWTRGTGLMAVNNTIAAEIEQLGARTFSTREMALNLVGLLLPGVFDLAQHVPIWADINGGLQRIQHVNRAVSEARQRVQQRGSRRQHVVSSYGADYACAAGHGAGAIHTDYTVDPLFNHQHRFARSPAYEQLQHHGLEGMANLEQVVVIAGYGEIGPYGHAETRWEMEAHGELSLEACVELAWVMGLIKHHNGELATAGHYVGWIDAKSRLPVKDVDIKRLYEQQILEHSGIRLLEPELLEGQDPAVVPLLRELQIEHDLEPFEATEHEAEQFKLRNGDKVDVWERDGSWFVRFLKGAVLLVPKALRFDRLVGGQLPTGWDPRRYGIPDDVVEQVDLVTCYALVATVEALVRAGITDPYELYAYFHPSEVGTSVGSGAGGVHSIRDLYRKRLTDKPVQSDILQETFVNTTPAWINMLLLSSAGAIKPPTGGCGTSVLSLDVAADTIRAGKARVMLAGGFEGFVDQGSYEFAQMGATSSAVSEFAQGREPREMSRPCTTTRAGFVEAQGAGIVVLMSAQAALEFGAPIYGVLAYSGTATDKQGYSLPAPGAGVLTSARQTAENPAQRRLLDVAFRRRQLGRALRHADRWAADERELARDDAMLLPEHEQAEFVAAHDAMVASKLAAQQGAARDAWGADFWRQQPHIAPLRGALAAWGLTADDIGLASFHGTATVANDYNECNVLDAQLRHIGRTPGHAVPAVCQKWLTGHPKGPAAAWMLNGALQSMRDGLVPGNRNADNIDGELQHEFIVFPSKSFRAPKIKAALLKSFGFGQVGAEILLVHADYLLATLSREQLAEYTARVERREQAAYRYWQDTFAANHSFVQVKDAPPFTPEQEQHVYLDPLARARQDPATGQYHF